MSDAVSAPNAAPTPDISSPAGDVPPATAGTGAPAPGAGPDPVAAQAADPMWAALLEGDWVPLTALDGTDLEAQPDRARLALLAAAGQAQIGHLDRMRARLAEAQAWGADRDLVLRVMLSGLHATLGRAGLALGEDTGADRQFHAALAALLPVASVGTAPDRPEARRPDARRAPPPEAGPETDTEAGPEVAPETDPETGPETAETPQSEATGPETGAEARLEAGPPSQPLSDVGDAAPHPPALPLGPLVEARAIRERARLGQGTAALDRLAAAARAVETPQAAELAHLRGQIDQLRQDLETGTRHSAAVPPTDGTRPAVPQGRLVLCSHHKSGTNFMVKTFDKVAAAFDLPIWKSFYDPAPPDWRIYLNQHGRLADLGPVPAFRGLQFVRHPKGLILSAALYHLVCTEHWVDVPLTRFDSDMFWALTNRDTYNRIKDPQVAMEDKVALMHARPAVPPPIPPFETEHRFDGRSYREILRDLPSDAARVAFEMRAFSRGVIHDMLRFPADRRFFRLRLEEVSHDPEMRQLEALFAHLGFAGAARAQCLEIASAFCLWNGRRVHHATTGVSDQWRGLFQGPLERAYDALHGEAALGLGYSA